MCPSAHMYVSMYVYAFETKTLHIVSGLNVYILEALC